VLSRSCQRWASNDPRARRANRCRASCKIASKSSRFGVASSAAAVGVGARLSATKSAMVKSVWWPTPLTTGASDSAIARATPSSLKPGRPTARENLAALTVLSPVSTGSHYLLNLLRPPRDKTAFTPRCEDFWIFPVETVPLPAQHATLT
jgi:hypothetical protein